MFAQAESEELLHLLSQVRLVADEEARSEQQQLLQESSKTSTITPTCLALTASVGGHDRNAGKGSMGGSPTVAGAGEINCSTRGVGVGRYTASSTATEAASPTSWTVQGSSNGHDGGSGSLLSDGRWPPFSPSSQQQQQANLTPATNAKIVIRHPADGTPGTEDDGGDAFGGNEGVGEAKQLFRASPTTSLSSTVQPLIEPSIHLSCGSGRYTSATSLTHAAYTSSGGSEDGIRLSTPVIVGHCVRRSSPVSGVVASVLSGYTSQGGPDFANIPNLGHRACPTAIDKDAERCTSAEMNRQAKGWCVRGEQQQQQQQQRWAEMQSSAVAIDTSHPVNGNVSSTVPLFYSPPQCQPPPPPPPRPQPYTAPSAVSAHEVIAQLFRGSKADVEVVGGGGAYDNAWRTTVEAELAELQRGARRATGLVGGGFTHNDTSMVSPLSPTSVTPYHQLLSQLRCTPPQTVVGGELARGGGGGATATAVSGRVYTPPEHHQQLPPSRLEGGRPTSHYTATVTAAHPPSSPSATSIAAKGTLCTSQSDSGVPHCLSTTASGTDLWQRMSPCERVAAATATVAGGEGGLRIHSTPDTVSKPVLLSSIAGQLHRTAMETGVSEPLYTCPPQQQPQQQQCTEDGQQRPYTSTPTFTAALTHAASIFLPPPPPSSQRPPPSPNSPPAHTGAFTMQHPWQQQQQQQTPLTRHWSPVEAASSLGGTVGGSPAAVTALPNQANLRTSPMCSLRPSPHPRPSKDGSPAVRRYTITTVVTPNTAPMRTTAMQHHHTSVSGGRQTYGGTPVRVENGAPASTSGIAREVRPRVQLSQPTQVVGVTATAAAATQTGGVARAVGGSLNAAAYVQQRGGGSGSAKVSPSNPHHTGRASQTNGMSAVSAATTASPSTSSSLTNAAAVQNFIHRLRRTAAASENDDPCAPSVDDADNSDGGSPAVPRYGSGSGVTTASAASEVISAAVILSMTHDQHGCRLLQAVLDVECGDSAVQGGAEDARATETSSTAEMKERGRELRWGVASGEEERGTAQASEGGRSRRSRRAAAFAQSVAVGVIIKAIEPKLDAVMADGYGNFLLQKVFDLAPDSERQRLLRQPSLQQHLCEVACSPHGTFAVQRLVETVRNAEEERLVFMALERDFLRLLTNPNGGHVLMKVMECIRRQCGALSGSGVGGMHSAAEASVVPPPSSSSSARRLLGERVEALLSTIQHHLLYVCQHKQGCCIVQKCLDFFHACAGLSSTSGTVTTATTAAEEARGGGRGAAAPPADFFERMATLLLPHTQELSTHPYGNYVVTRLVDVCYARGSTDTIDAVAASMQRELVRMCTSKFASNVVEHILRHCSERRIQSVCRALMTATPVSCVLPCTTAAASTASAALPSSMARLPLMTVVMDPYGNYVVQTLLTVAPVEELVGAHGEGSGMLPVLQQLLPLLSSRNYGRKLETKIELALLRVEQHQQQWRRRHP